MGRVPHAATALLLDWLLGEPKRRHPWSGRLALCCERRLCGGAGVAQGARRARGVCATLLLLAPFTAATATLTEVPYLGTVVGVAMLYLALGHRSLHDHARPVAAALSARDEAEARRLVGLIVSRDPASLDITHAATESVLENGNDAVFGALFWFVVAGAPGVVVYRLANTLDAM